jgi:hypothetical protein
MKQWKKGILATALVMGMALPVGAYAQTAETTNPAPVKQLVQEKWEKHQHVHKKAKLRHALSLGTHRQMYLTLLAEKYTPESVDEWQAAFEERERLVAEWKAAKEEGKNQELREEFRKMVQELHEQVKSGKLTREQMKQKIKEWRLQHFGDKDDEAADREGLREFLEQFKQIHEEFDAAIESGDEAKIKSVLPKLLDEVKAVNAHLAKKLEQKKN